MIVKGREMKRREMFESIRPISIFVDTDPLAML